MQAFRKAFLFLFLPLFVMGSYEDISLLRQSSLLAELVSGQKSQWAYPYAIPRPKAVMERGSVWFAAYPLSMLSKDPPLQALANAKLWEIFQDIGIQGLHTGPLFVSGMISQGELQPSVDGGFDPISFVIDPLLGTADDLIRLSKIAKKYYGYLIGDIIAGHTGIGPDFLLALQNVDPYPGIYHLIEIEKKDWSLLPEGKKGKAFLPLSKREIETLTEKGYISGLLPSFGCLNSNGWTATAPVMGKDGKKRRWVYLHMFKSGQPSLNWLDPSFGAQRIIAGNILFLLSQMENTLLRIDANAFLGIERTSGKTAWSEGHPLSMTATETMAQMARKMGGFSFQELNLGLSSLKAFSEYGPEFSYDFLSRAPIIHALVKKDASLLNTLYQKMIEEEFPVYRLVHGLQNHDEYNYELMSFMEEGETLFNYCNKQVKGEDLARSVQRDDYSFFEVYPIIENGICTTMIGLCATALAMDLSSLSDKDKERLKRAHLLLAFFNAMQPGIFSISGWDLLGCYPLNEKEAAPFTKDGDYRWVLRGAYDLLGSSGSDRSAYGLPKAKTLYPPLPKQMKDPQSFLMQLQKILKARRAYNIDLAKILRLFPCKNPSIFAILLQSATSEDKILIACNFSEEVIEETFMIKEIANTNAIDIVERSSVKKELSSSKIVLKLFPLQGTATYFQPKF